MTERWVTVDEVAAHLSVHPNKVYELLATRGLPGRRWDRSWRFKLSAVDEWMEGQGSAQVVQLGRRTA